VVGSLFRSVDGLFRWSVPIGEQEVICLPLRQTVILIFFLLCLISYKKCFLPFTYKSIGPRFCSNPYLYFLKERIKGREVCLNFRMPYIVTLRRH
jgi:hypothetical protein